MCLNNVLEKKKKLNLIQQKWMLIPSYAFASIQYYMYEFMNTAGVTCCRFQRHYFYVAYPYLNSTGPFHAPHRKSFSFARIFARLPEVHKFGMWTTAEHSWPQFAVLVRWHSTVMPLKCQTLLSHVPHIAEVIRLITRHITAFLCGSWLALSVGLVCKEQKR